MKFLLILLFCFSANSESLYKWTEKKVKEVYQVEYQEDIVLQSVEFVDDIFVLNDPENTMGIFDNYIKRHRNKITIRRHPPPNSPLLTPAYMESVLVHEYTHFFIKKAVFEGEDTFKEVNGVLTESLAYYIQELFLNEKYGKSLLDFYKNERTEKLMLSEDFEYDSVMIYMWDKPTFMYNTISYLSEDAPEKLESILDGAGFMHPEEY